MPETQVHKSMAVLDKVRALIAKTPFQFKGEPVTITISFGLASFVTDDTVENVFERADKALYKAKNQGRNQCVITENENENKYHGFHIRIETKRKVDTYPCIHNPPHGLSNDVSHLVPVNDSIQSQVNQVFVLFQ